MLAQTLFTGRLAATPAPSTALLTSRLVCLLANDEAEEVKQTTIAFRRSIPDIRIEAVYGLDEAVAWAVKEPWQLILFAERLARDHDGDLAALLPALRAAAPRAAIIVLGEHDAPGQTLGLKRFGADYYCTPSLGHASMDLPMLALQLLEQRTLRRQLELTTAVAQDLSRLVAAMSGSYLTVAQEPADSDRRSRIRAAVAEIQQAVNDLTRQLPMQLDADRRVERKACAPHTLQPRQDQGGDANHA